VTTILPTLGELVVARRGVYVPQQDSQLLIDTLEQTTAVVGRRVVDLCTGSGVIAIAAAHPGAAAVSAWDICPRAVQCARENARAAGVAVEVRRGPLARALEAGPAWAWNAGQDGRAVLDPLCELAPHLLADGGTMLLVQSEFSGVAPSIMILRSSGLAAEVVARQWIPFGPVLTARAGWLESSGRPPTGRRDEQLVVIRADNTLKPIMGSKATGPRE
jgi:release factor glutamine methyltransferase